jgi:N-acetylneuraminate synthase
VAAEAGSNHDGDEEQAHALIDAAADAGAGAVKFQLFRAATLYPRNCGTVPAPDGRSIDFYRELEQNELPPSWLASLVEHCVDRGVEPLCSPFDEELADRCLEAGMTRLKIASPEITHLPLLRHVAALGCPVILSTGMSTLGDIEEALEALSGAPEVTLLHCVTAYPCPEEEANLAAITTLRTSLGCAVGLSDHTVDPVAAPMVAAAIGATFIEKHMTTSRDRSGLDHSFSVVPEELADLVRGVAEVTRLEEAERLPYAQRHLGVARVQTLLGDPRKRVTASESLLAGTDRRALHALEDIPVGAVLTDQNVGVLRGERNLPPGMHPRWLESVLGATAQRPIAYGHGIVWDDLLVRGA